MQVIAFFRKRKECKRKGKIKEKEEEGKSGRQWGRERSVAFMQRIYSNYLSFLFSLSFFFFLYTL
jgi:hypothetical protein